MVAAESEQASLHGYNVLLFMTDQQRATQHFPDGWEEEHMPGLTRLRQHGLSFVQRGKLDDVFRQITSSDLDGRNA